MTDDEATTEYGMPIMQNKDSHPFCLSYTMVGKRGFEPRRLAAQDPKSCSSANSDTPPRV